MDANALAALITAYRTAPQDSILALVLDGACESDDDGTVLALIRELDNATPADPDVRRKAATLALIADDTDLALDFASRGDDPQDLMLQARIHLACDDAQSAQQAYKRAVTGDPVLEDVGFEQKLDAAASGADNDRALNVISLDGRRTLNQGEQRDLGDTPGVVQPFEPAKAHETIDFSDVGGLEDVKAQIRRRIIMPFLKPSLFQKFKRRSGGGVLLYGPPGCGKTMLARATAGECKARFINVVIAEILDMYVGESEKRLAAVFEDARRDTPTVLFFDELEALAARRQYGANDRSASMVSTFLAELDGFASTNEGVLVLGATNVPWAIDSAFRRPGRFDRLHFVPPPDREARASILDLLVKELPGGVNTPTDAIAGKTSGFSGADLRNLVETATDIAIDESLLAEKETELTTAMFEEAMKDVRPSTIEWLTTARNYAKYSNVGGQYDDVSKFLDKFSK